MRDDIIMYSVILRISSLDLPRFDSEQDVYLCFSRVGSAVKRIRLDEVGEVVLDGDNIIVRWCDDAGIHSIKGKMAKSRIGFEYVRRNDGRA